MDLYNFLVRTLWHGHSTRMGEWPRVFCPIFRIFLPNVVFEEDLSISSILDHIAAGHLHNLIFLDKPVFELWGMLQNMLSN